MQPVDALLFLYNQDHGQRTKSLCSTCPTPAINLRRPRFRFQGRLTKNCRLSPTPTSPPKRKQLVWYSKSHTISVSVQITASANGLVQRGIQFTPPSQMCKSLLCWVLTASIKIRGCCCCCCLGWVFPLEKSLAPVRVSAEDAIDNISCSEK